MEINQEALEHAEREALLAVARLDAVIEGARDAIIRLSPDFKIQSWNRAAQFVFGFEPEVVLEDFVEMAVPESTREAFQSWLSSADQEVGLRLEHDLVTRKGVTFAAECSVAERHRSDDDVTVFVRDLTESRRLEGQLRQSQKLEAVARLAGGMAHEINTPLQYMSDNIDFLTQAFTSVLAIVKTLETSIDAKAAAKVAFLAKSVPSAAEQTVEGLTHINKIVRAMKGLSGPSAGFAAACDLREAIESTILVATAPSTQFLTVTTKIADDLPPISCAIAEVAQVVLALVTNSVQAVHDKTPDSPRGSLGIEVTGADDGSVVLRVQDDGCGIAPEHLTRVFDPFFTTRDVGKGLGQGLTTVHTIVVERCKGRIDLDSRVGEGTTVIVRLPA